MPDVEESALRLTGQIYEAALNKQQWSGLVESIARSVDGQGGMLRLTDCTYRQVGFFETFGYIDGYAQAYRDHFIHLDPYREAYATIPIGAWKTSDGVVGERARHNLEYYNDYERPQDKEFTAATVLVRDADVSVQIGLHRGKQAGAFEDEQFQLLRLLTPHLAQSIQIQRMLGAAATRANLACASLEQLRAGVAIVDMAGVVLYLNRAAEKMAASHWIDFGAAGPKLANPADTLRLRGMIASAMQPMLEKSLQVGGEMRHAMVNGAMLEIRVIPLPKNAATLLPGATQGAVLFISHPGALRLPWQKVAAHYGLNRSEAKLAALLADGINLESAADQLAITLHTARSQLKSVFSKTGVCRQSELVAMLLRGVLALCNDEGAV